MVSKGVNKDFVLSQVKAQKLKGTVQKKNENYFMELKKSRNCKNMSNIILYHQNVQSLSNKMDELRIILDNNHIYPQFICFSEHHLKDTELSKISFNGYTFVAGYCRENSPGGGV
jgi:hypothetical protein